MRKIRKALKRYATRFARRGYKAFIRLYSYGSMVLHGETSLSQTRERLQARNKAKRTQYIEHGKLFIKHSRGMKKWYYKDTDLFVWARNEANAQRKFKNKLKQYIK